MGYYALVACLSCAISTCKRLLERFFAQCVITKAAEIATKKARAPTIISSAGTDKTTLSEFLFGFSPTVDIVMDVVSVVAEVLFAWAVATSVVIDPLLMSLVAKSALVLVWILISLLSVVSVVVEVMAAVSALVASVRMLFAIVTWVVLVTSSVLATVAVPSVAAELLSFELSTVVVTSVMLLPMLAVLILPASVFPVVEGVASIALAPVTAASVTAAFTVVTSAVKTKLVGPSVVAVSFRETSMVEASVVLASIVVVSVMSSTVVGTSSGINDAYAMFEVDFRPSLFETRPAKYTFQFESPLLCGEENSAGRLKVTTCLVPGGSGLKFPSRTLLSVIGVPLSKPDFSMARSLLARISTEEAVPEFKWAPGHVHVSCTSSVPFGPGRTSATARSEISFGGTCVTRMSSVTWKDPPDTTLWNGPTGSAAAVVVMRLGSAFGYNTIESSSSRGSSEAAYRLGARLVGGANMASVKKLPEPAAGSPSRVVFWFVT